MCGIVGALGEFPAEGGKSLVARMNAAIVHRGPDDEGSWSKDGVAFAMRRLSIIDLAGGHQPMWTEDGVGIVFNGEIYNYKALREELRQSGYEFHTQSDTETLLHLYHRDGLDAVHQLQGMFAICIYDPRAGSLFLARDRMGIKPLYYLERGEAFFFASEIKAILAGLDARPGINTASLYHYLTLRFVAAPETIWEGIRKLPPGHILSVDLKTRKSTLSRYWHVDFISEPVDASRHYEQEFEALFLQAVEKRLLAADVPVGVMLSGGLDSSAISAAAVELGHRDFHTFSVSFSGERDYDETPYAREVARHTGSRHHEIGVDQRQFVDFLPQLVRISDEPLADLASVPLYYVCQLARRDVKVVLSGEGSDEILAGYSFEQIASRLDWLRVVERLIPRAAIRASSRLFSWHPHGAALAELADVGWSRFFSARPHHMTLHWREDEKSMLWRGRRPRESSEDMIRGWYATAPSPQPMDQLQQVYCREWLVEDLLMKADKMSMANSLELRVPFLDHALVEWAAKLPLAWKVGSRSAGYSSKRILREFARKRLPDSIITRPKRGFPVPAYEWLRTGLKSWIEDLLCAPGCRMAEYCEPSALRRIVASAQGGSERAAHQSWVLAIGELWMQEWL
jgi:asparagine synthase (glutamine-hydrolysing)